MAELLPCPFCGPGPTVNLVMQHNPEGGWLYEVICQGCSTTMPCDDSEADAIADWNRRASSHAQDAHGRDQLWKLIAQNIACEVDCQKWPSGCGCAQAAADAIIAARTPAECSRPGVEALADWFYDNGHEFLQSDEEDVARALLDAFDVRTK